MRRTFALMTLSVFVLTAAAKNTNAASQGVSYTYDGLGRVTQVTYPNGTVITYTYDTAGNITGQQTTCPQSGC